MSKLKKRVLIVIISIFMLPMFVCLYSTLIFGNSLVGIQWLSAFLLLVTGLFLIMVADGVMK